MRWALVVLATLCAAQVSGLQDAAHEGASLASQMKVRMTQSRADVRMMETRLAAIAENARAWAKGMEESILEKPSDASRDLALHHVRQQTRMLSDAFSPKSLRRLADDHIVFLESGQVSVSNLFTRMCVCVCVQNGEGKGRARGARGVRGARIMRGDGGGGADATPAAHTYPA